MSHMPVVVVTPPPTGVIAAWGDSLTAGALIANTDPDLSFGERLAVKNPMHRVYLGGVPGETSTQIKARLLADTAKHQWPTIIWAGRNNCNDPTTVLADVAAMVAALGHDRYLVLSVINGDVDANEYVGGSTYNNIATINSGFAAAYGTRYVDVRSTLVAAYDPAFGQDVTDHGHDIVPYTLRSDTLHLNNKGYQIVATKIWSKIDLLLGSAPTDPNVLGVTIDPFSFKAMPADADEWSRALAAAGIASGGPVSAWTCEEKNSTSLTDFVGHTTLTVAGIPTGENDVIGWSKKSINVTDGAVSTGFSSTALVNLSTTSALLLLYIVVNGAPAAERSIAGVGASTDHRYIALTTLGKIKATGLGGGNATGNVRYDGTFLFPVVPIVLKVDRGASVYKVYTNQEIIAPTWTNPGAGGSLFELGDAAGVGTAPIGYLYAAVWTGTAAQMTDAQVRTMLQTLGWLVSW